MPQMQRKNRKGGISAHCENIGCTRQDIFAVCPDFL
jgi:hypothetical protein